jgi:hypothetical protein
MGYDCTLHVIDPASIDRFVCWFLREPVDAKAFEKAFDTGGLRDEVLRALEESPSKGGRALLHALLMFCSAEAPHRTSRGFCVGLWHKMGLGLADEPPTSAISFSAMAERLARIVERYPAFDGQLHTGIEGNYCVGHYVAPEDVGALREHVEATLDHAPGDWLDALERLHQVLLAAESRKLGYWEATDLEVVNANKAWLEPKAKKTEKKTAKKSAKNVSKRIEMGAKVLRFSREIDGVVFASCSSDRKTWLFDARAGEEPSARVLSGISIDSVVRAADGAIYGVGFVLGEGGALVKIDPRAGTYTRVEAPDGVEPFRVIRIGERALVIAQRPRRGGLFLFWLGDERLVTVANGSVWSTEAFDLGDGSALVNIDGPSFRLRDVELEPLPAMPPLIFYSFGGIRDEHVTRDGRLLVSGCERLSDKARADLKSRDLEPPRSRLVLIANDGTCSDAVEPLHAAQSAWPAKDGAVIVFQFEPVERDLLKVYWHERREVASIPHSLVGEKRGHCQGALYCAALDELWVSFNSHIARVAWSAIEALPRQSVEAYTASKAALVAENERKEHERLWAKIRAEAHAYRLDDPTAIFYESAIVEHPERGRGYVVEVDRAARRFTVEFEDRSRSEFALP